MFSDETIRSAINRMSHFNLKEGKIESKLFLEDIRENAITLLLNWALKKNEIAMEKLYEIFKNINNYSPNVAQKAISTIMSLILEEANLARVPDNFGYTLSREIYKKIFNDIAALARTGDSKALQTLYYVINEPKSFLREARDIAFNYITRMALEGKEEAINGMCKIVSNPSLAFQDSQLNQAASIVVGYVPSENAIRAIAHLINNNRYFGGFTYFSKDVFDSAVDKMTRLFLNENKIVSKIILGVDKIKEEKELVNGLYEFCRIIADKVIEQAKTGEKKAMTQLYRIANDCKLDSSREKAIKVIGELLQETDDKKRLEIYHIIMFRGYDNPKLNEMWLKEYDEALNSTKDLITSKLYN